MVQTSPQSLSDLTRMRKQVIRLSVCQAILREKLKEFLDKEGVTYTYVSSRTDLRKNVLESFLDNERIFIGRKNVTNLTTCIEAEDIGQEVLLLVSEIGERYAKLARYETDVIDIAFDLVYAFRERADQFTMAEFAAAFDGNSKIVSGALVGATDAMEALQENPDAIGEIIDSLAHEEQLDKRLRELKDRALKSRQPKIDHINQLIDELLPVYGNKIALVRDLELGQNNLNHSKLIEASDAQLDRFVARLTAALEEQKADLTVDGLEEFQEMYQQMHEHLGSQRAVADILGIAASTLSDAIRGKVSMERLSVLRDDAQNVLSRLKTEEDKSSEVSTHSEGKQVVLEVFDTPDILPSPESDRQAVEPEVSVPPVFQGGSDEDEIEATVDALKKSLRRAGALLYAVARLKDPEIKKRMSQPDIQRLLDETYMALEVTTSTHPGALTDLFQARREQRESRFASTPKKGAK